MARLRPYPLAGLIRRMFRELERRGSIFDLPGRAFFRGDASRDFSVRVHGRLASTPLGPAAGPQSQLAQNIVLSWLGGARVIELKTVQIDDEIHVPRPCIDMETVGYNVEWSQELKLEESFDEYVKASMLVRILEASGRLPLAPGATHTIYDMSVGYDFAGITSGRVRAFMQGMRNAGKAIDRFRREIPDEYREYRDLDFSPAISETLTLSTFHGCPSAEIEKIVDFLVRQEGLHVTIKLNPMLLGRAETDRLLHDVLGYHDIRVPEAAFERDATWNQAIDFVDRLGRTAAACGSDLGVKFTNTLIVENHRRFFGSDQKEMYLSGPPLHVLAMHLVRRFRRELGNRFPVSFSGGIDRTNFADAVALGLAPVTVCTDLLKPGGYSRARGYMQALAERMDSAGASTVGDYIIRYGSGDDTGPGPAEAGHYACQVSESILKNTEDYVERATANPRYARSHNDRRPRKIGRSLRLFDCITCDKCVPVCPNDANFTFVLPAVAIPIARLRQMDGRWQRVEEGQLTIDEPHQLANFADFCNDCGNCDVFCPEDGGPYLVKPRLFGTREAWIESPGLDGFFIGRGNQGEIVLGRFASEEYVARIVAGTVDYSGPGFAVTFDETDPEGTIEGQASGTVDLTYFRIMNALRTAILGSGDVNYVNAAY
jgi:putative selenate reductase